MVNDGAPSDAPRRASAQDKRRRFRELAERRTNKALEAIARIGNLSNRHVYEFEDAEVRKIVKALRDAVSRVEDRFQATKERGGGIFKL
jgi:hypothetical protein